ncbi:MAG: outer membrane protein transport protein [Deltaproteobacteria bacterium]|nr:outer membrane protein transport protein [Deltaproteobacteria bacterium]
MCTPSASRTREVGAALIGALVALAATLLASPADASGYLLFDQSAEGMGKVSAVVASTKEPAAVWYNPAGLSFVSGHQMSLTGMLYLVRTRFTQEGTGAETKADPTVSPAFAWFASGHLTDRLTLGMGVYSAWGLGAAWPPTWPGRENTVRSSMTTYTFNPTVAYRLSDHLSLGAGFDAVRAVADLTNGLPAPIGGSVRVGAGAWGYGFNAGILARILPDRLHAALAYRSQVSLSFEGKADFDPARPEFARDLRDQGGTSSATLPDMLTAGLMFKTRSDIAFSAEASLIRWSVYDKQVLKFDQAPEAVAEYHFKDVVVARFGVDGPLGRSGVRLRTGLMYEQKPSRPEYLSPSLPDTHILDVAVGAGYASCWWKADLGYILGMNWPTRATGGKESPEGTYWTTSHVVSVTFTAKLGAGPRAAGW